MHYCRMLVRDAGGGEEFCPDFIVRVMTSDQRTAAWGKDHWF